MQIKDSMSVVLGAALLVGSACLGALASPLEENGVVARAQIEMKQATGNIKTVNEDLDSFVLETGTEKSTTTLSVNEKTVYLLNGKVSTRAKVLKAGAKAEVSWDSDTAVASRIEVTTD